MPRLARRLAFTAVTATAVGVLVTPALAAPCASGEKITGRTEVGWVCTNIDTGASRIVPFRT